MPRPSKSAPDAAWLRRRYIDEQATTRAIAAECEVSPGVVSRWLAAADIPARSKTVPRPGPYLDPAWLRRRYIDEEATAKELADECGVAMRTILSRIESLGVDRRPNGAHVLGRRGAAPLPSGDWHRQRMSDGATLADLADECGVTVHTIVYRLRHLGIDPGPDAPRSHLDDEWLRRRYEVDLVSAATIGAECGVAAMTVLNRLRAMGVRVRPGTWAAMHEVDAIIEARRLGGRRDEDA